jgi:hypothetical protein
MISSELDGIFGALKEEEKLEKDEEPKRFLMLEDEIFKKLTFEINSNLFFIRFK